LRVLQQRQVQPLGGTRPVAVDVRIIAAANVSLEHEVRMERFRADVYYRLNEFLIKLPPLRERDNILELANAFAEEAATELGRPCRRISEAAAEILLRYHWPGNVRQLRNVIRRASLLASEAIEPEHLTIPIGDPGPGVSVSRGEVAAFNSSLKALADAAIAEAEANAIRVALQATAGNKSKAARLLHVDYKTLHLKMKQYRLDAAAFRQVAPN
jgi:two-component system nitrogen regulation response regulator GlnG